MYILFFNLYEILYKVLLDSEQSEQCIDLTMICMYIFFLFGMCTLFRVEAVLI